MSTLRRCSLLLGALLLAGCTQPTKPTAVNPQGSVLCLVAASTRDVVQEVGALFTQDTGHVIKINADDSSKLATQIVQDAPADLFLSANEKWATHVADKGFAAQTTPLLGNTLVLIVPKDNPAKVMTPQDLAGAAVKRVAVAGPTVPAGIYARQALTKLGLWDGLEKDKKIVAGENVRVTLTYVERGETDAGIVYGTDARISGKVATVATFPADTHDPIVYPLVLLKAGEQNPAAKQFFDFLRSPRAAEVFVKHGFTRLPGP